MTATYNPKSAAAEARANYREVTERLGVLGLDTAIPESVRALAENTVNQTRAAYNRSTDAFEASVATFEKSFDAAGQGAALFNRKIIDRSSTSSGAISIQASTSPTWPAPRTSPTWSSCTPPIGASRSAR